MINYENVMEYLNSINDNIKDMIMFTLIFGLVDKFLIPRKSRWFSLHTISNMLTTYYSFPDLILAWTNPFGSIKSINSMNWRPLNITVTLHFYHMIFFNNLHTIDWIHHIVMMYVALYMYLFPVGASINAVIFFVNGLPGCIDYFLLALVKHEKIHPNTEKIINVYLNNWIRSPGLLISNYVSLLIIGYNLDKFTVPAIIPPFIPGHYVIDNILLLLIPIALYWNSQYFNQRVLLNFSQKVTE
uniref:TLC domain-containing protein n=1 Tax=viral metagenome TaxID=1070528 RepID=A0A6C0E6Z5_9ZZZZ